MCCEMPSGVSDFVVREREKLCVCVCVCVEGVVREFSCGEVTLGLHRRQCIHIYLCDLDIAHHLHAYLLTMYLPTRIDSPEVSRKVYL